LVKVNTAAANQPAVAQVWPAGTLLSGTPTAFDPIVGAAAARAQYGVDGTGMTVAVIDTGVDYNNPALGGGFGPGAKVVAGYDFADNTPDPIATGSQHGTAVAGLLGSDAVNDLGVAPGVKIVALRVTGSDNTASLSNIASALQWVINNHSQYNISVINMSLSDGGNYAQNWFAQDGGVGEQITNLIGQLESLNIPVVSASGNSFTGQQGEGFTSIVSGVISVTATDTSDHLLPDSQRLGAVAGMGTMTDLAAPGEGMVAPTGDNDYSSVEGTSFATPLVTGAVVLLQQIYRARFGTLPTVGQVTQWLEKGSDPIYDPVTGLTIGRLDIPKAASLIPLSASTTSPLTNTSPATISIAGLHTTASTGTAAATPVNYRAASGTQVSVTAQAATSTPASTPAPSGTPAAITTPAEPTGTTAPSIPPAVPAVLANPAPTPTSTGLSPKVRVFVNGVQVNTLDSYQSSMLSSIPQTSFDSLLKAMSAWAAGSGSGQTVAARVSQVRIWNAASQANPLSAGDLISPSGSLAVRITAPRRALRR
jgi:type VI secretion system secreted protein VgrG